MVLAPCRSPVGSGGNVCGGLPGGALSRWPCLPVGAVMPQTRLHHSLCLYVIRVNYSGADGQVQGVARRAIDSFAVPQSPWRGHRPLWIESRRGGRVGGRGSRSTFSIVSVFSAIESRRGGRVGGRGSRSTFSIVSVFSAIESRRGGRVGGHGSRSAFSVVSVLSAIESRRGGRVGGRGDQSAFSIVSAPSAIQLLALYCSASARWCAFTSSLPSRSAIVRASLSTR